MIMFPYKMINDIMMSNGGYSILIVCKTQQQANDIYKWFLRNIEGDKQIHYSQKEKYIKNKNNVLHIGYIPSETVSRGYRPHLVVADTTFDAIEVKDISSFHYLLKI